MITFDRSLIKSPSFLLLIAASVLVVVVFIVALLSFPHPSAPIRETSLPTPTSIVEQVTPPIKPIHYNKTDTNKMMDSITNRQTLLASDSATRANLITQSQQAPYLYSSEKVRLEYVSSPDEFMAEILTNDVSGAKAQVQTYLQSKGLSLNAICHLPLVFYLSIPARNSLPADIPAFNPLPNGC